MDREKKGLDDEEGENGHQDGEATPALGKENGAHDAGVEKITREKQEAEKQQHGPYPRIAQEEGGDIDKGVDEDEEAPVKYFSFVGSPAEPVIIVFHGLRIMTQNYFSWGKKENISTNLGLSSMNSGVTWQTGRAMSLDGAWSEGGLMSKAKHNAIA